MYKRIHVNTSEDVEHYINIGYDISDKLIAYLKEQYSCMKAVLIVDENVLNLYKENLLKELSDIFADVLVCVVPEGEKSKSFAQFSEILNHILNFEIDRKTPVIAIGGGVTGDLGGFVSASCLRGMPLIHVPTSLLAMVDSSIGGKTGINHEVGKNLVGAFYEPKAVFTDLKFLETLPDKELINGLGEVIKYGMIRDERIFKTLEDLNPEKGFKITDKWIELVDVCAEIKVDIVQKDFKESGLREILNFGHTFAHVIERVGNYSGCSHGEAVFMGMWGAVKLSNLSGFNVDISNLKAFRSLYTSNFKTDLTSRELTEMMRKDKKARDGAIKSILLKNVEDPFTKEIENLTLLDESWEFLVKEFN